MNELEKIKLNLKDNYIDNVGFELLLENVEVLVCEEIELDVSENNIVMIN